MMKLLQQRILPLLLGMLLCVPVVFGQNQVSVKGKVLDADSQTIIELSADTTVDSGMQFAYKRDHFLRIGAVATGSGVNSNKRYNFSPVFKMSSDFSKVEEVTDWEEDL